MGKVKLQLLTTTDDTKDNTVTFTSADELNPTAWKDVNVLSSNEKHLSILNKISNMFSNIRYLYKNVGGIKGLSSSSAITTQGEYALDAREKNASVEGTLANQISTLNSNLQGVNVPVNLIGDAEYFRIYRCNATYFGKLCHIHVELHCLKDCTDARNLITGFPLPYFRESLQVASRENITVNPYMFLGPYGDSDTYATFKAGEYMITGTYLMY